MGRYGSVTCRFYTPGDLNTPISSGGSSTKIPVDGDFHEYKSGDGQAAFTFVNDAALNVLAAAGNICYATQTNAIRDDLGGAGVIFCEPFIIRSRITIPGTDLIMISGPDLLTELKRYVVQRPLGHETVTNTTLTTAASAPITGRTVASYAPKNSSTLEGTADTVADIGREILITLNNGVVQPNIITNRVKIPTIEPEEPPDPPEEPPDDSTIPYWYELRDRLVDAADAGNAITLRERQIRVADPDSFAEGTEVHITTTSGTFSTLVETAPENDLVTIRDGMTAGAVLGAAVVNKDYSQRSTSDVAKAMFFASGWSTVYDDGGYTGTAAGTRYPGGGDTVYDILRTISEETGEFFRIRSAEPSGPLRTVRWIRDAPVAGSGGTVRLVEPTQANMASEYDNKNRAILLRRPEHEGQYDPVTQLIPIPRDPRVNLFSCSATALAAATTLGFSVVTTGLGLYAGPYVQNNALQASIGTYQRKVTFSEVSVEGDNANSITAAADQLLFLSISYLQDHVSTARTIRAQVVSAMGIRPGDMVELYYAAPTGEYTIDYTGENILHVHEVRRRVSSTGSLPGVPITELVMSPTQRIMVRGGVAVGRALKAVDRMMTTIGAPPQTRSAVYVGTSGGTGGTGTPTPPVVPGIYLPLAGGTMTGNIALGASLTVDGVDVSAHAANASAHHAPVTATSPIGLAGQALSLILASNSGLIDSSGLKIRKETNSGLTLDANGVRVGTPLPSAAASTNAVTGDGHSHAATNTTDANTTFSALLAGNAEGGLTLGRLAIGTALDTTATLKAISKANDDYTLFLQQKSGQTADIWRVENSSGTPLVRLTGSGNLESGNPAFVSGSTGWRIEGATGNAEFNDIVARGEFRASVFVADELHATGGTLAVLTTSKVTDKVGGSDNTLPAVGSNFTLNVQAQRVDPQASYFAADDVVRMKYIRVNLGGTTFEGRDVYCRVISTGSLTGQSDADGEPGYYPMTVRRLYGGETGYVIPTGTAAIKWAKVSAGSGVRTGGVILTSDLTYAPYIDIFTIDGNQNNTTWQSAPVTPTPHVRLGNLRGVLGKSADEWGIAMGVDLSSAAATAKYLYASATNGVVLQNVDISLYNSGTKTVEIDNTGNVKFGTAVSSGTTTTFEHVASTGTVRIGPVGLGKPNLYWGGTNLHLRQNETAVISLNGDGSSEFAGPMTIGTSGGIWQGTGSFASPTTGLKIWRDSGVGRLATYSGGVEQITIDTSGRLTAGADAVRLNSGGISIVSSSAFAASNNALKFVSPSSGAYTAALEAEYTTGPNASRLQMAVVDRYTSSTERATVALGTYEPGSGRESYAGLYAESASFVLLADTSPSASYALLTADYIQINGLVRASGGISVGSYFAPNAGQFVSDLDGNDWNGVVLLDTTDIAHGMTGVVHTATYGTLGKNNNNNGGLLVAGYGETIVALNLAGYGTTTSTAKNGTANGAVQVSAFQKSGTGAVAYGANANLFVVRNGTTAVWGVDSDGDHFYDGTGSAFDDYDDVALLRAADLTLAGRLDAEWERRLLYNREALAAAKVITFNDDGRHFVSGKRFMRLLAGGLWQTNEKIDGALEGILERLDRLERRIYG